MFSPVRVAVVTAVVTAKAVSVVIAAAVAEKARVTLLSVQLACTVSGTVSATNAGGKKGTKLLFGLGRVFFASDSPRGQGTKRIPRPLSTAAPPQPTTRLPINPTINTNHNYHYKHLFIIYSINLT